MYRQLHRVIAIVATLFLAAMPVSALEEITNYDVSIVVMPEGQLQITESITVIAENRKIKRGIYRDFPTTYRDRYGNRVRVKFEVLDVRVNGAKENYFFKNRSNGVRTYIGKKNRFVSPGEHTYTIKYVTDRQLGFFEKHDELYFNAIPHGFEFPIRRAKVEVYMPSEVLESDMTLSAYTGRQGSKAQNYAASKRGSIASFTLSKPLGPYEGMTVVVEFPKGIVHEPTQSERIGWFLNDNKAILILLGGTFLIILFYLWAWRKVGKDPKPGTIVPVWEPPPNYSAADVAYVKARKCTMGVITACVVEAATKGWVTIDDSSGVQILKKKTGDSQLSVEAQVFIDSLFLAHSEVALSNKNHRVFRDAIRATERTLEAEHRKRSFKLNREYLILGVIMSLLVCFGGVMATVSEGQTAAVMVTGGFLLLLTIVFGKLLEAPTASGRKDLDRIEGFKQYLGTAERDTFREMGAPDDSLQIYEAFLPFAVALGVDYVWGSRFKNIIRQAVANNEIDRHRADLYQDSYTNRWFSSDGIGSGLQSAITSASTAPGSSSGGGGGGSSGGGGGGGGGGGW